MSIGSYLKDTKSELKHVSWPTRRQTGIFTVIVIILSVAVGLLLGLFDAGFAALLRYLIVN